MSKIGELNMMLKPLTIRDLQSKAVPTVRDVLIESVGRKKPESAKQSIGLYKLTERILEAKESLELSELESGIVRDAVEQNPAGYFPFYHGQVLEILEKSK